MYSIRQIISFLNLEPRKHIALHQMHKRMFFLATSYVYNVIYLCVGKDESLSAITPVCSVTQSFRNHSNHLLSVMKTVVLLDIFVEVIIHYFLDSLIDRKFKRI